MKKINLIMILHSHQPVGNFDHVFEENYQKAYLPYIDVMNDYPELKFVLHYSGCLYDWLLVNHPEYFDKLNHLVQRGSAEIMGGGYQEPILTLLPEWDRNGQIRMMIDFIKKKFKKEAAGYWLTERVWEQSLVKSLADAGVNYTAIDDSHFKAAGLSQDELFGYFTTEDEGRVINLFPGSEDLRYLIPFHSPEEVIEYILSNADETGNRILCYADDGEKFGGWPGTYNLLYKENWLRRFFDLLMQNRESINVITGRDAVANVKPLRKLYIPDGSYREMTEWVLPAHRQEEYHRTVDKLKETGQWEEGAIFVKGGFWRNFRVKYSEANNLYARMMDVSTKLYNSKAAKKQRKTARGYLYKAQCNCPHWHGVFGGLYLNFLRFGTYKNLIKAEKALNGFNFGPVISGTDYDFDGREEVLMENRSLKAVVKPDAGGSIIQLDSFHHETNLLDTMTRRREAYHQEILDRKNVQNDDAEGKSIHELQRKITKEIVEGLVYDSYDRNALIDHFFQAGLTPGLLQKNRIDECGDFCNGEYLADMQTCTNKVELKLSRKGRVTVAEKSAEIELIKRVTLLEDSGNIDTEYTFTHCQGDELDCKFACEWNFSLLSGDSDDRYYYFNDGEKAGRLGALIDKPDSIRAGLVDEWQNINIDIRFTAPVRILAFPIRTVSQSEGGYDFSYQSSAVYFVKDLSLKQGSKNEFKFTVYIGNKS